MNSQLIEKIRRYRWLIVGAPTVLALLLMAYVPGLNTSTSFLGLAIVAIYGGLVVALTKGNNDEKSDR